MWQSSAMPIILSRHWQAGLLAGIPPSLCWRPPYAPLTCTMEETSSAGPMDHATLSRLGSVYTLSLPYSPSPISLSSLAHLPPHTPSSKAGSSTCRTAGLVNSMNRAGSDGNCLHGIISPAIAGTSSSLALTTISSAGCSIPTLGQICCTAKASVLTTTSSSCLPSLFSATINTCYPTIVN